MVLAGASWLGGDSSVLESKYVTLYKMTRTTLMVLEASWVTPRDPREIIWCQGSDPLQTHATYTLSTDDVNQPHSLLLFFHIDKLQIKAIE